MAKSAPLAEPHELNKAAEEKLDGFFKSPTKIAPRIEARSLRGTFAKSICSAHGLAMRKDREACDDGVPCHRLADCMDQADATIRYLELRRALLENDENT